MYTDSHNGRCKPVVTEPHNGALRQMVQQIQGKILVAEIAIGLKKINLPGVDFPQIKQMVKAAHAAIEREQLGYALLTARKQ